MVSSHRTDMIKLEQLQATFNSGNALPSAEPKRRRSSLMQPTKASMHGRWQSAISRVRNDTTAAKSTKLEGVVRLAMQHKAIRDEARRSILGESNQECSTTSQIKSSPTKKISPRRLPALKTGEGESKEAESKEAESKEAESSLPATPECASPNRAVRRALTRFGTSVKYLKHRAGQSRMAVEAMEAQRNADDGGMDRLASGYEAGKGGDPFMYSAGQMGVSVCAPAGWVEMNQQQRQLVAGNIKNFKKEKMIEQREREMAEECTFSPTLIASA